MVKTKLGSTLLSGVLFIWGCSSNHTPAAGAGSGGSAGTGGSTQQGRGGVGGTVGSGGTSSGNGGSTTSASSAMGGSIATGGITGSGGVPGSGGITGSGGTIGAGGTVTGTGKSDGAAGAVSDGSETVGEVGPWDAGGGDAGPGVQYAPSCTGSGKTYYASPSGTGTACSASSPCSLSTAASNPKPGDIVCLRGGTYTTALTIDTKVSGTATSWITFSAYPGELPIINGGVSIPGKSSTHLRFNGIATQGGESGFANPLTPSGANGDLEFLNCIADMSTMNGIGFHGAAGLHVAQCIVAHTGSSTTHSWSSGVDLWSVQGTPKDNIIERTIAFENVDMQCHSDGSGFIVDVNTTGATFANNIGFRNGGSCIRICGSTNTVMINNTCFGNGLDPKAGSVASSSSCPMDIPPPTKPGEIWFVDSTTTLTGAQLFNNLTVAAPDQIAINRTPSATGNNIAIDKGGATPFFNGPPTDLTLTSAATSNIVGKGTAEHAPALDVGFDPKCITNTAPSGTGVQPWWKYSIDYNYIRSIGGTVNCFHPKTRTGTPDIGAYSF
jgi:hypothetical protein